MNDQQMALQRLNALNEAEVWNEFIRCCGASKWALQMMQSLPFENVEALFARGESAFETLERSDWLEAFAHHPKIGDFDSLRSKFVATREWAGAEQAGTNAASEAVLRALAQGNHDYEKKFGWIFIICATGKSADEMLAALQARLQGDPGEELANAAEQQKQITRLRLSKLVEK